MMQMNVTTKMPVWLDPALLLEIFHGREIYSSVSREKFLSLLNHHNFGGHISKLGWNRIRNSLSIQGDSATMELNKIQNLLTICHVKDNIKEIVKYSGVSDWESALEVACAKDLDLGAIITHDPQKFEQSTLFVFSVDQFLNRLEMQERLFQDPQHSANKAISIVFCTTQQLSLLHPSEVIEAFTGYRIRNSIQTVIEIFDVLRKDSLSGMTKDELSLRSNYKPKTIQSVIWDFQNFHMASCNHGFIQPNKYFLNLESHQVAEYIAEVLKNHVITQSIYLGLPSGRLTTRENIKQLILRTKFDGIQISDKSANDYVSRMLSWLYFAGLLEKRSDFIVRPIGEGKQKGLLHEEPMADQLSLQLV